MPAVNVFQVHDSDGTFYGEASMYVAPVDETVTLDETKIAAVLQSAMTAVMSATTDDSSSR